MNSLPQSDRQVLARPDEDLPHYSDDQQIPFPFRHKALWADADLAELRRYIDGYSGVVKLLQRSNLAYVRNGIDHSREEHKFPSNGWCPDTIVHPGADS